MKPEKDIYFQKALQEGYLARSAYKLLQIDEVFNIFEGVTKAIDLCSAPGSWTQVIYNKLHKVVNNYDPSKLNPNVKIISVDMMPMEHFPGVIHLEADISQYTTMKEILGQFGKEKADIIVCDGAIDVVGMKMIDYYMHHRIFISALYIMLNTLRTGGTFVIKIFIDKGHERMIRKLELFFKDVTIVKPHCSRNKEAFAVCRNYVPLPEFDPVQLTPFVELKNRNFKNLDGIYRKLISYLCADCYEDEVIEIMRRSKKLDTCDAENSLFNILNTVFKDRQVDKKILKKRFSKNIPVYQITKGNTLEYVDETTKAYFKNFTIFKDVEDPEQTDYNDNSSEKIKSLEIETGDCGQVNCDEDKSEVETICLNSDEALEKFAESIDTSHSGKSHMPVDEFSISQSRVFEEFVMNMNCSSEIDERRSKIGGILEKKIEALRLENRGKFCRRGFNVDEWKFFSDTHYERCTNSTDDQKLKELYRDFQEVYKQIESANSLRAKTVAFRDLFNKQQMIKTKVRNYIFEDGKL